MSGKNIQGPTEKNHKMHGGNGTFSLHETVEFFYGKLL